MLTFIANLIFILTVNQSGTRVALHYPKDESVQWVETCVYSEGKVNDKTSPGDFIPWTSVSCWPPRFALEEMPLMAGALRARASLEIKEGGVSRILWTTTVQVRPEEREQE